MAGLLDALFGGGGDQSQAPQAAPAPPTPNLPKLGFADRMQAVYSPELYRAREEAYRTGLQQQNQNAIYQALLPMEQDGRLAKGQAAILALNPPLAQEMLKPQVLAPGAKLDSGIGLGGGQGQQQGGGQAPQGPPGTTPNPTQAVSPHQNTNGMLDNDTLDMLAKQYNLGDDSSIKNAGMGAIGQINKAEVMKRAAAQAKEAGLTAEERAGRIARYPAYRQGIENLTKIQTNMGTAGIEFQKLYPQFEAAVQKIGNYPGGQIPSVRALEQWVRTHSGDPNAVAIGSYLNTLANVYGRAISTRPGGPTVSDKEHFRAVLDRNWNPAQIGAAGIALNNEIKAAHDSVPLMAARLKVQFGLADKAPADMIAQAKDAIGRGAPRDKVIEAIEQKGFKAEGL